MNEVQELFERSGAVLKGHFKLSSGRHSETYFEKFRLLERPEILGPLCDRMADPFRESGAQVVVGPTLGGVLLAYEVARSLGLNALYVEREEGKRALRRGATLAPGTKVLVVDDVLTTGLSVVEVLELLRTLGAEVVGVSLLVDRSTQAVDFGARTEALLRAPVASWEPAECPLCQSGSPVTSPGSRPG